MSGGGTPAVLLQDTNTKNNMALNNTICDDILAFQDFLKQSRKIDDNIINTINSSIPTISFADKSDASKVCGDIDKQIRELHENRRKRINDCIAISEEKLTSLRARKEQGATDISVIKDIKKEQTKNRLLQAEIVVEDVIKARSNKVFYERCRNYYQV